MTKGAEIFKPFSFLANQPRPKALTSLYPEALSLPADLFHVKYSNAGLKDLISKTYPATKTLSQLKRRVMVTALDLYQIDKTGWVPTTLSNLPKSTSGDVTVLDAALSTSAAPIYFPPHVFTRKGQREAFADGGIFANNPCTLAAANVIGFRDFETRRTRSSRYQTTLTRHRIYAGRHSSKEPVAARLVWNPGVAFAAHEDSHAPVSLDCRADG